MSTTLQQVIFKNKTLWLVARPGEREGPLCSVPEEYMHGRLPYAHLHGDGRIARYFENIGDFDDLTFTGVCQEVEPAEDALDNILEGLRRMGSSNLAAGANRAQIERKP